MPPCLTYSRSRGVSSRRIAVKVLLVGVDRDLAGVAALDALDREHLLAGQAERLAATRRRGTASGRIPIISRFERWIRS